MLLQLNCYLAAEVNSPYICVSIENTAKVLDLQDEIRGAWPEIAAGPINLRHVSFPMDDSLAKNLRDMDLAKHESMMPLRKLASYFRENPDNDNIHVLVPNPFLWLNCFLVDQQRGDGKMIKILRTQFVETLKQEIIRVNLPLANVEPNDINVWRVSLSKDDNYESNIRALSLKKDESMTHTEKLASYYPESSQEGVFDVLVSDPFFSLNWFVIGDSISNVRRIKILRTETVGVLKQMIMKEQAAEDLGFWKISFPIEDLSSQRPPTLGPQMNSYQVLSRVLPHQLEPDCIHVVVLVGAGPKPAPSSFRNPLFLADQLTRLRQEFCGNRKPSAPSAGARPQRFNKDQAIDDLAIPCDRPLNRKPSIPLTLLHEAFGRFIDDAKNCVPSPGDVELHSSFVDAMVPVYDLEHDRKTAIHKVLQQHGVSLSSTEIGKYATDGDLSAGGFRFAIFEFKNEIGSTGAEPYFQAILYYLETMREHAPKHINSVLPCLFVLVFGPYVAFAGGAWTDRPVAQMLSPALPCHSDNVDLKFMLLRHLAAFRLAIQSLESFYEAGQTHPGRNPTHPYPSSFGAGQHIVYLSQMSDRYLFFGTMGDGSPICIKFAPQYCEEAHALLSQKGAAPYLYDVQRIPGGWYMVVMEDVSETHIDLFHYIHENVDVLSEEQLGTRDMVRAKVVEAIKNLHQENLVHGDVRNLNILVKKSGPDDGSVLLVDFDWAGKLGDTRYPMDLNTKGVKRPEDAKGSGIITTAHDLAMLNFIWEI